MLIIVEGPDCAGKTTLVDGIERYIRAKWPHDEVLRLHAKPPTKHPLDEYVVPLLGYQPGGMRHVICDRWHIGELVYPRVFARPTQMTTGIHAYVEMFLEARGALTVVLAPDGEILTSRLASRGDDVVNEMQMIAAWDWFRNVTKVWDTRAEIFKSSTPADVVALARGYENRAVRFNTMVGSPFPKTLLLGDVRNCAGGLMCPHKTTHPPYGTAFMPYSATSGNYLFSHAGWQRDWAVANACDTDSVYAMWKLLHKPPIVALGVRADKRLNEICLPHAAVPHPQFIRRFHYWAGTEYVNLINEVSGSERKELKWRPSSQHETASTRTR